MQYLLSVGTCIAKQTLECVGEEGTLPLEARSERPPIADGNRAAYFVETGRQNGPGKKLQ